MTQNESFETIPAKKKWPKWVAVLGLLGIAAVLARVFCRGCCKGDSCSKPA